MNLVYKFKLIRRLSFLFILSVETSFVYAQSNEEDRIRTIVQGILKEKDNKISLLEQRINQLESGIVTQEKPSLPAVNPIVKTETTAESKKESFNFGEKLDELKKSASESGLEFSGFLMSMPKQEIQQIKLSASARSK